MQYPISVQKPNTNPNPTLAWIAIILPFVQESPVKQHDMSMYYNICRVEWR